MTEVDLNSLTKQNSRHVSEKDVTAKAVVLLASYPRTGSNWLRRTIVEILEPGAQADVAMPSFLKAFPEDWPSYPLMGRFAGFIKTHLHPDHKRFSEFDAEISGVISIRRHPLDILLSSLNYARIKGHQTSFLHGLIKPVEHIITDDEIMHYIDQFIECDGFPWWSGQCGQFSLYQDRWRNFGKSVPYMEICYEGMFENPRKTLAEIALFLRVDLPEHRIDSILESVDQGTKMDGKFFWRRRAFNFESMLPADVAARFAERMAPTLKNLGY